MSDDANSDSQRNGTSSQSNTPPPTADNIPAKMIEHFKAHKVDVAMWLMRCLAVVFTFFYVLPIFGTPQSAFNKVLLSNAAVSALRLHQRLPAFTFSREFLARLFVEDSCHYLMYSIIFFNVQPTFLILIPIVLFAILHASSYSLKLLDIIGQNSWWGARFLISLVEFQAANILKAASFSEIFIMPLAVVLTFMGRAGLMTPIVYYHFLVMRYSSRRNPYTRNAFAELRMTAEALANRSPAMVGNVVRGAIAFVSRLAPPPQPAPAQ
ncbi:Krueppel homolog 2 [Stomoxys calcitrans]|uniref:Krueppel homolog 2 n=1 Tax=Stomoxys calcitrans TaxID=35570 RepID=UPI0027E28F61|nr:Krueppel homolog 2 [Stomoxys calcitrans]XP_013101321.2 Krueppel homolog 2 [Stomoxys calcitrans]XP_013101322.2 Krueppel homolog 2 [Stomoxys calcitrans]XP_013101323.2 Krueppel homolog 2 [Stomoxys calcitrans]XP_013101324.2 Krueppel homolog 2 [Stomoxys calcitrans]